MPTTTRPVTPALHVPSRRTVLRAAAWTAPAVSVAVAVPAFAATSGPVVCANANYEVKWASHYTARSGMAVANLVSAAGAGTVGSAALTMGVTSRFFGEMEAASSGDGTSNLAVSPFTVGGTAMRGLTIMQRAKQGVSRFSGTRSNHGQEITLLFNRPVTNLKFKLTDIDSMDPTFGNGQYQDRISVSGTPSGARANQVTGTGRANDPWKPSGTNIQQDPSSGARGNVDVSYANQPASAVYTITYWNDQSGTLTSRGLQGVFLTDLTFTASSCA
ncbi:hypothetical protein AAII07_31200 [Microvirga sp. 0TCS3.31]